MQIYKIKKFFNSNERAKPGVHLTAISCKLEFATQRLICLGHVDLAGICALLKFHDNQENKPNTSPDRVS